MSQQDHPSVSHLDPDRVMTIRPWWDPQLAIDGHPVSGDYTERFWLGILGPSVVVLLRRMARGFDAHPNGFQIVLSDTARAIGLGGGTGQQAPLNRTIARACTFNMARRVSADVMDVRLHVPTLTSRQLARLPLAVRTSHRAWLEDHARAAPGPNGPVAA